MSVDIETSNDQQMMDVDSNNNEIIESNGNIKNHKIENNNIELSNSSQTTKQSQSPQSTQNQSKIIDKHINGASHDKKVDNKNLKEDIDDSIVLKKSSNTDSNNNNNNNSNSNNNNNNEEKKKEDNDNNNDKIPATNKKLRKIRKIGIDENGSLMPGFEDVNDDQLAFSSESDFAIFIKQISSEIPLQRV